MKPLRAGRQIHDAAWLDAVVLRMASYVRAQLPKGQAGGLVGIETGGAVLARRLAAALERSGAALPVGTLDITYYRDDRGVPKRHEAKVRLPFAVGGRWVFLVDDVLYKGRTARAAIDALVDQGRPEGIRLLVLLDREGREFPIQADFAGESVALQAAERFEVELKETHGEDAVLILPA